MQGHPLLDPLRITSGTWAIATGLGRAHEPGRTYRIAAPPGNPRKEIIMGIDDKANYTVIHHIGTATSAAGKLTGEDDLKREGQGEGTQDKFRKAGAGVGPAR